MKRTKANSSKIMCETTIGKRFLPNLLNVKLQANPTISATNMSDGLNVGKCIIVYRELVRTAAAHGLSRLSRWLRIKPCQYVASPRPMGNSKRPAIAQRGKFPRKE